MSETIECRVRDIAEGPLDPAAALDFVTDPRFGGQSMFVGRVRRQNQGREVTGMHYDMFDPLALNVFAEAARSAIDEFGPELKVHVSHAKGELAIGDYAVVVAVGSPHRDEAFRACRAVIEWVKHRAPIWKRERYIDGVSEWSEGSSLRESDAGDAGG